jgi:F420-dependent methylenetetrahydromethanopterin dehydrogenase
MNAAAEATMKRVRPQGFQIPYAVAGAFVTLLIAVASWSFGQSMRLTAVETEIRHLATSDQVAAQTQKLDDFQREYERDRINDQVTAGRNSKP